MTSLNDIPAKTCCEYPLIAARKQPAYQEPASHQRQAIDALWSWYRGTFSGKAVGILVLPTGGGKTFSSTSS